MPDDTRSVGALVETAGARSFGPLLLLAELIVVSPISGIPGVPTVVGVVVALVSVQMLRGRRHFRLPGWIARRRVPGDKLRTAIAWTRRPARFADHLLRPRLLVLTDGIALYAVSLLCLGIAGVMPLLELVPFSASLAGAALAALGVALTLRDGLFGLVALLVIGGAALALVQTFV